MDFFTSDTHFGHKNIIDYCKRPFRKTDGQIDEKAHDEELVRRWNEVVKNTDRVFHLGDVALSRDLKYVHKILERLNGQKFWVYGNHDHTTERKEFAKYFTKSEYYMELRDGDKLIVMSHYPFLRWNQSHFGSWMLHGHCHGELEYPFKGRILDVGMDAHNYYPISREAVEFYMLGLPKIEHHYYKPGEGPR